MKHIEPGITPKLFYMIRHADESGVSGTGHVLDGVLWPNGRVTVCWRTERSSVAVYSSYDDFYFIHIESHGKDSASVIWK